MDIKELYELIKGKKENAEREYANTKIPYREYSNKDYTQGFFKGEINAYNNMIQLLENSGELKEINQNKELIKYD